MTLAPSTPTGSSVPKSIFASTPVKHSADADEKYAPVQVPQRIRYARVDRVLSAGVTVPAPDQPRMWRPPLGSRLSKHSTSGSHRPKGPPVAAADRHAHPDVAAICTVSGRGSPELSQIGESVCHRPASRRLRSPSTSPVVSSMNVTRGTGGPRVGDPDGERAGDRLGLDDRDARVRVDERHELRRP